MCLLKINILNILIFRSGTYFRNETTSQVFNLCLLGKVSSYWFHPRFYIHFYRPQTKFAKVMFSQVSLCPQWGCLPLVRRCVWQHPSSPDRHPSWSDTPWADIPLPPGRRSTSGRYTSHWNAYLFQQFLLPSTTFYTIRGGVQRSAKLGAARQRKWLKVALQSHKVKHFPCIILVQFDPQTRQIF